MLSTVSQAEIMRSQGLEYNCCSTKGEGSYKYALLQRVLLNLFSTILLSLFEIDVLYLKKAHLIDFQDWATDLDVTFHQRGRFFFILFKKEQHIYFMFWSFPWHARNHNDNLSCKTWKAHALTNWQRHQFFGERFLQW